MGITKPKPKILQEIAEALKEWGKYNQEDADEATRQSPKARQATKNAMELLLDNLGLLYEVRQEYGCHQPLQKLFGRLSDVASKRDKPETDLGAYWVWGRDFTQPQLCMGNVSFIDECLRWASLERAKAKGSQKTSPPETSDGRAENAEQKHKDFLLQAREDIDGLIRRNPANEDFVWRGLQTLRQIKAEYDLALKKAYKAAQKDPKLQTKDLHPGEGWEWVCKNPAELAALDERNLGKNGWVKIPPELDQGGYICFWTQELPFDPVSWISYYYGYWEQGIWLGPKPKEPPTEEERLACEYALFVIIYDNAREIPDCDRFIGRETLSDRLWPDSLWVAIESFGYHGRKRTYDERKNAIQSALDHVKQDIARQQPADASGGNARRRLQRKKQKRKAPKTEYSLPLAMTKWAQIFGLSENTFRKVREKYHFVKVSDRRWKLPKHELPAEYLEKYRHAATPNPQ